METAGALGFSGVQWSLWVGARRKTTRKLGALTSLQTLHSGSFQNYIDA